MNIKMKIVVFFMCLSSMHLTAQNDVMDARNIGHDSLIIERESGHKIRMIWDFRKNIKKNENWKSLLDDFQSNFTKVQENIPDFDFYKIDYIQNDKLVVDEISGRETYAVNDSEGIKYTKSNSCNLMGKDIQIYIEFNDINELFDPSIKNDIINAIDKVKHRFYFSRVSRQRHFFDAKTKEMTKGPKPKVSWMMPLGTRLGILKNQPNIELRSGIGALIGSQNFVSLNANFILKYDELTNQRQQDVYIGINWVPSIAEGFGVEHSLKVYSGIDDYDDIFSRSSLNYYPSKAVVLGVNYYLRKQKENEYGNIIWGFHVGFGI